MTYILNNTNGEELTTILDGQLDTKTTSLTLIGKNAVNFGKSTNENFIRLLENFANVEQPVNAITGQLWYDTSTQSLNVYNGDEFKNVTGSSRTVLSGSTSVVMAPGGSAFITIDGAKGYILYKVKVSSQAIVSIFTSNAKRLDNGNEGLVYTHSFSGPDTKIISPGVIGFNDETPPGTEIPIIVTNTSDLSVSKITVELTLLKIE